MLGRFRSPRDLAFGAYRRSYVRAYWALGERLPPVRRPQVVELELTNACNMACPHCHRGVMGRSEGFMAPDVFERLVTEIETYPTCAVRIVGLGESALHPRAPEFIERLRGLPGKVEFTTNGHLFERMTPKEICDSPIDLLGISIDGIDEEGYRRMRPGGDYRTLLEQVREFDAYRRANGRKGPEVKIRHVLMPKTTDEQVARYKATWEPYCDQVAINVFNPIRTAKGGNPVRRCYELFFLAHVRWNGDVPLCQYQFVLGPQEILGTLAESSLEAIWASPRLAEMRGLHRRRAFDEMPFCKACCNTQCSSANLAKKRRFEYARQPIVAAINKVANII